MAFENEGITLSGTLDLPSLLRGSVPDPSHPVRVTTPSTT
jgi:hypothetical protein